jgi:hypothetical protein
MIHLGGAVMKSMCFVLCLFAGASLNAVATDFAGTWKAVFTGPMEERPKMVSEMVFDFKVDAAKLTGMAHMAAWPGDAEISNGKIDGDRITFTVIGKLPWKSTSAGVSVSGYPKLVFDGVLKDHIISLKLNWGSILTTGEERSGHELPMSAKKVSE